MRYKVQKETKPKLSTFGQYKAVAVHTNTIETRTIEEEVSARCMVGRDVAQMVLTSLSEVLKDHLRRGDKVRLRDLGMLKLEIESDKVDDPKDFKTSKHIRGVRLHFLPVSEKGKPELYQNIKFEKEKE